MAMAGASTKPVFEKEFLNSFQNKSFYISEHLPVIQKYIAEDCDHKYNVALGLQLATESQIKSLIELHLSDNDVNICLSGGVALNSVMTGKILDWFPQLKNIFIPLVPYDGGLAIGASQYLYHHILGKPKLNNKEYYPPYLGAKHSNSDIYKSLNSKSGEVTVSSATDLDVINLLSCGKIVSIFRGSSESGRRALGNRSILADPRSAGMKDLINEKVKHRQWFRPFAPSILRECVSEWFEKDLESPYMGVVLKFKEDKIDEVPAVCHIDGTGRLQTVSKYMNPWYYNFLNLWKEKSGVPILLNTSFNDREPIVETPLDAIKCFLGTEIDYLFFPETNSLVSKALNE